MKTQKEIADKIKELEDSYNCLKLKGSVNPLTILAINEQLFILRWVLYPRLKEKKLIE